MIQKNQKEIDNILVRCFLLLLLFFFGTSNTNAALPTLNFRTIDITNGLSHNMVHAIYKDSRGFIWLGTQLGLDKFDGISVESYSLLKNYSVYTIIEADPIMLWIGTDKGLIKFNRQTETIETISLNENQVVTVKCLYFINPDDLLVGTDQGLFLINRDNKIERINLDANILSRTNRISKIIKAKEINACWITSSDGLIYLNVKNKESHIYRYADDNMGLNTYRTLTAIGDTLYIGTQSEGLLAFDTIEKHFLKFSYKGNSYITTLTPAGDNELYVGTDGSGIQVISIKTGKVLSTIEYNTTGNGLSSNAIYSFLKDENTYWIGTYMGGLNYTPMTNNLFSIYSYNSAFTSRKHNVRSFYILENGRKLIGTRDGLFYISEKEKIVKSYTSKTSILQADIILSIYPINENELFIGTYGGGLYTFNLNTLSLSFFDDDPKFKKGSFSSFFRDSQGSFWISSSSGVFMYNPETKEYVQYTNINSGLKDYAVFSSCIDSNGRLWFGTNNGVCLYDKKSKVFISDIFPSHLLSLTKFIRYIYEDSHKNLWFCDDKNGVVKADEHLTAFEHYTTDNLLPSNSVASIKEDRSGGLWFATQRGLLYYSPVQNIARFYSLYDGIPSYIFNNAVQETTDGTIWWGNEAGLVSFNEKNLDSIPGKSKNYPAIISIVVSGKTLKAGDDLLPYSPSFMKELNLVSGNSVEFGFSALNYSHINADIFEYYLEGYDNGWQVLTTGNKVSYDNLPNGNFIFKIKASSAPERVTSLIVNVRRNISMPIWVTVICLLIVLVLFLYYSRLLLRYRKVKRYLSNKKEENVNLREKYSKAKMEEKQAEYLKKQLTEYMQKEKPYLNLNLKLQDIANGIGCTSVELSQLLNVYLNSNFTDFVNRYRVDEFIARVQDKSAVKYTLATLSEQSGFSSRTSFFRSFKKIKGTTPAEYIKEMGIELK